MLYNLKKYFRLLLFFICNYLILFNYNCSTNKYFSKDPTTHQISNLKKGDRIIIEFFDHTKLDCIFLKHDSSKIIINVLNKDIIEEESIKIRDINTIQLNNAKPKKIFTVFMVLAAFSLLLWASYLSGLGNFVP